MGARVAWMVPWLAGCAPGMSANLPATRFVSPEAEGGAGSFGVGFGMAGSTAIVLNRDYEDDPVDAGRPELVADRLDPMVGVALGVLERLDLAVQVPIANAANTLDVRWQLVGEPRRSARAGNVAVALTLGGGLASIQWDEFDGPLPFGEQHSARYTLNARSVAAGLSVGRRVTDDVLLYGGPSFTRAWLHGVHSTDFHHYDGQIEDEPWRAEAWQVGASAGLEVRFRDELRLVFEAAATWTRAGATERLLPHVGGWLALPR